MGRELVAHLLSNDDYQVVVWNRTPEKAASCLAKGAELAKTPGDAVRDAPLVITCLFGPQAARDVVLDTALSWAAGACWVDTSTVGPQFARTCAEWACAHGVSYVQAPVLGSLGPARAGQLGVLIGSPDARARALARSVSSLWADADRIVEYDEAGKAAAGKLLVNYGLAVGMQSLVEACQVGEAGGLTLEEAVALAKLPKTPLSVIAGMKGDALMSGDYSDTQFSANLLAKDVHLMLDTASDQKLPALEVASEALDRACQMGHGEDDFSALAG